MNNPQLPLELATAANQTFDSFVAEGNRDLLSILKDELPQFSFLWGGQAVGKSHLLSAIENNVHQKGLMVMKVTAEQMLFDTLEFILPESLSLLMVDDVDQLSGSRKTEMLLFNLFNHCQINSIQLVFASVLSSRDSLWQLPDLRSRLNSGLVAEVLPLKGSSAVQLFERELKNLGVIYQQNVISYVNKHWSTDYSGLYMKLQQIAALTLRERRKLTVPLLKKINF